jgi:hypothetical protein
VTYTFALFAALLFVGGAWTGIFLARRFHLEGFTTALNTRLPSLRDEIEELRNEKRARLLAEENHAPQETPAEMVQRMMREESLPSPDPDIPLGAVPPMPGEGVRRGR